jgi:hypothetical protein
VRNRPLQGGAGVECACVRAYRQEMRYVIFALGVGLAGCAVAPEPKSAPPIGEAIAGPPPPPPEARTVEQFDTTSAEDRLAAASASGGRLLGSTVASLGDPTRPGFWIETSLVKVAGSGRLVYPVNGKTVEVELIPLDGGSSRVSLAALRLLEAPLTDLPVLEVYAR